MQIGKTEPRPYSVVHYFERKHFGFLLYLRPGAERRKVREKELIVVKGKSESLGMT